MDYGPLSLANALTLLGSPASGGSSTVVEPDPEIPANAMLNEDGNPLLNEDGSYLLNES